MTEFYAQPYSLEHTGFYFRNVDEYEAGMKKLNARGCEEVEIQFIDGDNHLARLAQAAQTHQGNVALWYEALEDLDETETAQIMFLLDLGYSLEDALDRHEEVCLYPGTARDYADELVNDCCEVPENLRYYIDYEAIARDMAINGEITEIDRDLIVTNANEF